MRAMSISSWSRAMTGSRQQSDGRYCLVPVVQPDDWAAYHAIRKAELFASRHPDVAYDTQHPDETRLNHFPLLLKYNGAAIGTVRVDLRGSDDAVIRLVAIARAKQGKGHGRILGEKIEEFARMKNVSRLLVNAAPDATGYYERLGYQPDSWAPSELIGIASQSVQMSKVIR